MAPFLAARPSVTVTLRLLAACVLMAGIGVTVAGAGGGSGQPTAAVPTGLVIGVLCAALTAHLLYASARSVGDPRLVWLSIGVTFAMLGLATNLFAQPTLFPNGGPVSQSPDANAARYLLWHVLLMTTALLAVVRVPPTRNRVAALVGAGVLVLTVASILDQPLGALVDDGNSVVGSARTVIALVVVAQLAIAVAWWKRASGIPSWGDMCVLALLVLGSLEGLAWLSAKEAYEGIWWASLVLRAGQFAVPAVGLLIGFIAVAERLREFESEFKHALAAERDRSRLIAESAPNGFQERAVVVSRLERLIRGQGLDVALQPIVELGSHKVVGAEALARFTGEDGERLPTEATFIESHTVGLGNDLELAVIRLALGSEDRLPSGMYVALNVSPGVLVDPELERIIAAHETDRQLVLELTEHEAVEDYGELSAALERLRALGARVAVDDVGSGFASFRHVTRVNPDILKLDRTLVNGIDDDPVRQSLASAIVAFARDVGATVVSEGIESPGELTCLRDLAVGCGQGFYLARPNLGVIQPSLPSLPELAAA